MTQELATTLTNTYYPGIHPTNVIDYGQYYWPYGQQPTYIQTCWPVIQQQRCAWCQGMHTGSCERIKSVTYREDGTVKQVEFFPK